MRVAGSESEPCPERWNHRTTTEAERARTDQSFLVPKSEIAENGYDLSLNRYKEVVYDEVEHKAPAEIIVDLELLLSIPAFDRGSPDVVAGDSVGSSKQLVEPGDVMISRIVPHIRRSWIVPTSGAHRQIASAEWIVVRNRRIDGPYFRQLLVSDLFNGQFMQTVAGVGGSLLRDRPAHVAKIRVPLPSLDLPVI